MRALRFRFLLVTLAVLVPVGLLVWRAMASVEIEQERRHQVIAERVFDEIERWLSDFLREVESRPVSGWNGTRPAWLRGTFTVAADGRVTAPPEIASVVGTLAKDDARAAAPTSRAGSTVALADDAKKKQKGAPAYDALSSLNKAVEQRAARQKAQADAYERDDQAADRPATGTAPFIVRLADPRHLVLSRPDGRGGREGLVVDPRFLIDALSRRVVDARFRSYATVAFGDTDPAPGVPGAYQYVHRFAEPFDALTARLTLRPVPGFGDASWVVALATLLVVAILVGLAALYRMVAVAVGFAERRSNFVAAVTHELKTPLTAIRMYAEMLRDGIVPSEAKRDEYHRHITAESERLSRLIDNVLEFSRLERNARPMELVVGAIGPVLSDAAAMLRPHVERGGLTLRVAVDDDLPPVRFERDALLQIVVNLVDNAVKYAGGAAPSEIVLAASRMPDGRVVVRVRDHGPGVPREHLRRVFEPFHRGERELTRRTKGTGLGLALVRHLTEAMGGRVTGRNLTDGGFQVEVLLPEAALTA